MWTKNSKLRNTLKGEVKYYMGMIDVAPTILNMLGYKNEYALGHDIFNIKNTIDWKIVHNKNKIKKVSGYE